MHELAITKSVLNIAIQYADESNASKVLVIRLKIGELRDIVIDLMQKCFTYLARDTIAEGALLIIETVPSTMKCSTCGEIFDFNIWNGLKDLACPKCRENKLIINTGKEFFIKEMEII